MIELNLSILENLPEAAVYVVLGRITAINPMAAHYLPQLEIDGPVPGYLDLPRYGTKGVGTFTACLLYTSGILCCWYDPEDRPLPQGLTVHYHIQDLNQVREILTLSL